MKTKYSHSLQGTARFPARFPPRQAFTLVELLVVLAIVLVLSSLLAPAVSRAKGKAQSTICLNHLKQMGLSWLLYAHDHEDHVPPNSMETSGPNKTWVQGWLDYRTNNPDNTNILFLQKSHLWPYHGTARVWRCPADKSASLHDGQLKPRVRSYAMNPFLNPRCETTPWRQVDKITDLAAASPSQIFVLLDEREESINNGVFSVIMDQEAIGDWPALDHDGSSALVFADGHTRLKAWRDPRTKPPFQNGQLLPTGGTPSPGNPDLSWLQKRTTSRVSHP